MIEIVETPRDAMQGIPQFIPTKSKADYINALMKVGFDVIDFGSFVSPKAIPQLKDTGEVHDLIDMDGSKSKLLAVIGNVKGAEIGSSFEKISYLGYPHSSSNTFLKKNINSSVLKSRETIENILKICEASNKELTVYLSMAFGNPYGEKWNIEQLIKESEYLNSIGIDRVVISDTIGVGTPEIIQESFSQMVPLFPDIQFGLHLHSTITQWYDKIDAAYKNGCRSFEGVLNGLGGCPMAGHKLVGNLRTGLILEYFEKNGIKLNIDRLAFENAITKSITTFALLKLDQF